MDLNVFAKLDAAPRRRVSAAAGDRKRLLDA